MERGLGHSSGLENLSSLAWKKAEERHALKKIATILRQTDRYLCVEMQMIREMF